MEQDERLRPFGRWPITGGREMADGIVVLGESHRPGPCSRTNPLTPTHVDDHSLDRDDSFDPSIRLEYSPPPFCRPRDG